MEPSSRVLLSPPKDAVMADCIDLVIRLVSAVIEASVLQVAVVAVAVAGGPLEVPAVPSSVGGDAIPWFLVLLKTEIWGFSFSAPRGCLEHAAD